MTGSAHRPLVNAPPNHPSPKRLEHELASARRWRCKVSLRLRRATPAPHHACMHAWAPVRRATHPRPRDHMFVEGPILVASSAQLTTRVLGQVLLM